MALKVTFVNRNDKIQSFKFHLFGGEKNRVKVATVLTIFKSTAIILDDGSILEGGEDGLSVDCFEAGKLYNISLLNQGIILKPYNAILLD